VTRNSCLFILSAAGKIISSGDFNDLYNFNKYIIGNDALSNIPVKAIGKLIVEKYSYKNY